MHSVHGSLIVLAQQLVAEQVIQALELVGDQSIVNLLQRRAIVMSKS